MNTNQSTKPQSIVSRYTETAIAADKAFGDALKRHGQDRWETPKSEWSGDVWEAYNRKTLADLHMTQAWELWRS